MKKAKQRRSPIEGDDGGRRFKKRPSPLGTNSRVYVDYKDVELLKKFVSDKAKIRKRRVAGNDMQQQREVAKAVKNAREMGLLSYASGVTQARGRGRSRDDRNGNDDRDTRSRGPRSDRTDRTDSDTFADKVAVKSADVEVENSDQGEGGLDEAPLQQPEVTAKVEEES